VLNIAKTELYGDLTGADHWRRSQIFEKACRHEFDTPDGEPYAAIIGDYEFTHEPEDIALLSRMSQVAAKAFCPFISSASPKLLACAGGWTNLVSRRDPGKVFEPIEYAAWRSFRDLEFSCYCVLVLPRVLARLPYGRNTKAIAEFDFQEAPVDGQCRDRAMPH